MPTVPTTVAADRASREGAPHAFRHSYRNSRRAAEQRQWHVRPEVDYTIGLLAPPAITIADISGDGKLDIIPAARSDSGNAVSVLRGTGSGAFAAHVDSTFSGIFSLFAVAIGDMNGEGKIDVVTADTITNVVTVLLGNGQGAFTSQVTSPGTSKPLALVSVDVNSDGKLDLVVRGSDLTVMLGRGNGTFTEGTTYPVEGSGFGTFGDPSQ